MEAPSLASITHISEFSFLSGSGERLLTNANCLPSGLQEGDPSSKFPFVNVSVLLVAISNTYRWVYRFPIQPCLSCLKWYRSITIGDLVLVLGVSERSSSFMVIAILFASGLHTYSSRSPLIAVIFLAS